MDTAAKKRKLDTMDKNAKIIGIWGGRGSGKSTCTKEQIRYNDAYKDRVIVFDPAGDYADEKGFSGYKTLKGLYTALRRNWNGRFRLVITVGETDDPEALLEQLAKDLFKIQEPYKTGKDHRQITLVVEEMSICYPEKTLSKKQQSFKRLINLGRHYGVNIIGVSQRMAEVKKNFVGNCAEHYFLRMGSYADYQAVGRIIGPQDTEKLKTLKTHHYLHFEQGKIARGKNRCDFRKS